MTKEAGGRRKREDDAILQDLSDCPNLYRTELEDPMTEMGASRFGRVLRIHSCLLPP